MSNVVKELEEKYADDKNVMRIVEFIKGSKRGIYLGRKDTTTDEEM